MNKKLRTQLKNVSEIKNVLRNVKVEFEYEGNPIETLLIYLPCKHGECDHSELFRIIKDSIFTNFVLKYSEIIEKLSINPDKGPEELFKKSVRKISQHTAKGELGELLLFTILEVYFSAPKILSKIVNKSSRRVAVHGADAVHAQFVNNMLRLYLGESKLHKNFSGAVTKAVASISEVLNNYEVEFDLIDSNIDFPEMDTETQQKLITFLNPFTDETEFDPDEILYSPCFIGFQRAKIFCDDEQCYIDNYIKVAEDYIGTFYSKLKKVCEIEKTALFLLPFSSVDDLVEQFIDYMGITK